MSNDEMIFGVRRVAAKAKSDAASEQQLQLRVIEDMPVYSRHVDWLVALFPEVFSNTSKAYYARTINKEPLMELPSERGVVVEVFVPSISKRCVKVWADANNTKQALAMIQAFIGDKGRAILATDAVRKQVTKARSKARIKARWPNAG